MNDTMEQAAETTASDTEDRAPTRSDAITEVDSITHVLLLNGWHDVADQSFELRSFKLGDGDDAAVSGFAFSGSIPDHKRGGVKLAHVSGPCSSILAIRRELAAR